MRRRYKMLPLAVGALALLVVLFAQLPRPVSSSNQAFDLSRLRDGAYVGGCDNGLVKVQVEVRVENHTITDVLLLKHDNGMGSAAERMTEEVVRQQSVEIDAVSGATMSSKTILKAVENALSKGQENI